MSSPPCGSVRGQSSSLVWNVRGPCCVSTRQRRIANKGELLLIRISQRQMPRRLGPREATAYRYRPLLLPPHRPQRAVGPPLEAQRLPPSGGGRFAQGQRHGTSFLLELQLQLVQMPVLPFRFRQQFGVRAVLDQPAVLDHEQPRRLAERREPVRDREHGPPRDQPFERL